MTERIGFPLRPANSYKSENRLSVVRNKSSERLRSVRFGSRFWYFFSISFKIVGVAAKIQFSGCYPSKAGEMRGFSAAEFLVVCRFFPKNVLLSKPEKSGAFYNCLIVNDLCQVLLRGKKGRCIQEFIVKMETKQTYFRSLILFILLIIMTLPLFAQNKNKKGEVNDRYRKEVIDVMTEKYRQGDLQAVVDLFEKHCGADFNGKSFKLYPDFKKVKGVLRAEVFDLSAKSYLAVGQLDKADYCIKKLFALRYDESFKDYWLGIRTAYSETYRIAPKFLVGIQGGVNKSFSAASTSYSIFSSFSGNTADYSETYENDFGSFSETSGFQIRTKGEYAFSDAFLFGLGAGFERFSFARSGTNIWQQNLTNQKQFVEINYLKQETINVFEFPFYVKYRSAEKRVRYEIAVGISMSRISSVTRVLQRTEVPGIIFAGQTLRFPSNAVEINKNVVDQYIPEFFMPFGTLTLSYPVGNFILTLDASYRYGIQSMIRADRRKSENELVYRYHDVPDNQQFSSLLLNVGLKLPLHYEAFQKKR